jgi:uncharacterized protein
MTETWPASLDTSVVPWISPGYAVESQPFWHGLQRGELLVQQCPDTGRLLWPPLPISPYGRRRQPAWVPVCGRGTVWSYAIPHPPLLDPYAAAAPYVVVVVSLAEDPAIRMIGNLADPHRPSGLSADAPAIGTMVRARIAGGSGGPRLLWEISAEQAAGPQDRAARGVPSPDEAGG